MTLFKHGSLSKILQILNVRSKKNELNVLFYTGFVFQASIIFMYTTFLQNFQNRNLKRTESLVFWASVGPFDELVFL